MLRKKVTKREVLNSYYNVISIGYCDAWYLLRAETTQFYTCGVYGWNADVYEINDSTVIVTGYRPFGNVEKIPVKDYNEKARKIWCDMTIPYETKEKRVKKLLDKFIKGTLEQNKRY